MRPKTQSKKKNKRKGVVLSIAQLYTEIQRLQSEMAIMYHLHEKEIQDMNLVHEQMDDKIRRSVIEEQLEQVVNNTNNESS